ncbi:unnamed protein product [Spirodela intermedia]|uniref:Uncharacterized protein n=2 Tax=Spirodela intermedia TaxID=51605 RepID=A0ABN7ECR4_SPIIN|nr:unnamed protein product [Spirodela intermedia]CAA6675667.1 unnamed protein product [Spirodela intermedia]CAA7407448.1 unnamed protein product [Spirodela intermedia]
MSGISFTKKARKRWKYIDLF